MSVKKQIPSLRKLYSFYETIQEEFSEKTDVYSYVHYIFDISQSQHRIAYDRKGSTNKKCCEQVAPILRFEDTAALYSPEEVNISTRELRSLVDSLLDFLKTFDKANKGFEIPLPKLQLKIGSTKSKDNLFAHCYEDIILTSKETYSFNFPISKQPFLRLFHEKVWTT